MSAREWEPGEAEVEAAAEAIYERTAKNFAEWGDLNDGGRDGMRVTARAALIAAHAVTADLLPVPQAVEGAIERAIERVRELLSEDAGFDPGGLVGAVTFDDLARRIVAALAAPVQPGRSEAEMGCGACVTCDPPNRFASRMYVCATCGNKRCPAAVDCREWECSGSNDPDQPRRRRAALVADTTDTEGGA